MQAATADELNTRKKNAHRKRIVTDLLKNKFLKKSGKAKGAI